MLIIKSINTTYNPYPHFGQQSAWPRGYPLHEVSTNVPREYVLCETTSPLIRQGIVNGDPDVDAIFRMLRKHTSKRINLLFDVAAPRVAIPPRTYAPYNSQNTITHYRAFWALALPVTPNSRVCDIWRSYWAQRLVWLIGSQVGFYTAGTVQFRTDHSYIKDFIDENQIYHQANDLVKFLDKWHCNEKIFFECVKSLSHAMAMDNFWSEVDANFIEAWLDDLLSLNYQPPALDPIARPRCHGSPTNVIFYPHEQLTTYGEVPTYYLPPYVRAKFAALTKISKARCPNISTQSGEISPNKNPENSDILLIIQLESDQVLDYLVHLEMVYRSRFEHILYCGNWNETAKQSFHKWRASFAEIAGNIDDPQMECLYKAAEMHYLVKGYLVIHQHTLLIKSITNKNKSSIWITKNWITPAEASYCHNASCTTGKINLRKANVIVAIGIHPNVSSSCEFDKPGKRFRYLKRRVFYVPTSFDKHLHLASRANLDGISMTAWLLCTAKRKEFLIEYQDSQFENVNTDNIHYFNFTSIKSLCFVFSLK